jgi:uncharacterized peroxidase-related enzyme
MTKTIQVPTRDQVSEKNQGIFDTLTKGLGFVPNLYATLAFSDSALGDYLAFQNRKSSITSKEKEVIHLVVSQVNGCTYCLSAHTVVGKMNGFTDEQILEIRQGKASFDSRLDALAQFVYTAAANRGTVSAEVREAFFAAGFSAENLIDVVLIIGGKTIANYLHGIVDYPIDFPLAPTLESAPVTI